MSDKTAQECVYRAMTEMGRLRSGEVPDTSDYQDVLALHEPLIAQLSAEGVYYIDNSDNVAEEIFLPYCRLLACAAAPSFGVAAIATLIGRANAENVNSLETRERAVLRVIGAKRPSREVLKGSYF